jgi:hypothetical protein
MLSPTVVPVVFDIVPAFIGPENVVCCHFIFLLEYLNTVPRVVDYTRQHSSFIKCIVINLYTSFE